MRRRSFLAALGALSVLPAFGQDAKRTRLILLGTKGGPRVGTTPKNPSTLLLINGVPYVVDCGYGASVQLVAAGVPMLEAIDITGRTSGNKVSEKAMAAVKDSVTGGGTVSAPMRTAPEAFPSMVVQMIAVGEETGALDTMLTKIADFYEDEVAAAVKALTSILEPLMIVIVGAMVGFIVISMYMPLFKVYDAIK